MAEKRTKGRRKPERFAPKFLFLVLAAMLLLLPACKKSDDAQNPGEEESPKPTAQAAEGAKEDGEELPGDGTAEAENGNNGKKILIAYFTAAENSGVDAVSSASYTMVNDVAVGRVRAVADMIQEYAGGEMFSIRTSTVYPADGGELIDQAADEQEADFRPELTTHIENLDEYDVIFVGFPNWWYDMPMVLYSFFEEYDFSGKTIVPFNVHNGSRFSSTIRTIQELEPEATVIENGFTVSERNVADAKADVAEWLDGLEY